MSNELSNVSHVKKHLHKEQRQLNHSLEFTIRPYYYPDVAWLNLVNSWSHISGRGLCVLQSTVILLLLACSLVCVEAPIDYQFKAVREKCINTTLLAFQRFNDLLHVPQTTNRCCLFFSKGFVISYSHVMRHKSLANGTVHA